MIASLRQRLADLKRERRIAKLKTQATKLLRTQGWADARPYVVAMQSEIALRSEAQNARLEAAALARMPPADRAFIQAAKRRAGGG